MLISPLTVADGWRPPVSAGATAEAAGTTEAGVAAAAATTEAGAGTTEAGLAAVAAITEAGAGTTEAGLAAGGTLPGPSGGERDLSGACARAVRPFNFLVRRMLPSCCSSKKQRAERLSIHSRVVMSNESMYCCARIVSRSKKAFVRKPFLILGSPRLQPSLYLRYIDDVFGVWPHGAEELSTYLDFINTVHPSIKFTAERSDMNGGCLPFLDTLITVHQNGSYQTELYYKPMAAPIIMPYSSAHPAQMKKSVLKAQLKRAVRLSSDTSTRERSVKKVADLFKTNGYPERLVRFSAAHAISDARRPKSRDPSQPNQNQNQRRHSDKTFISLPYIDDSLAHKIQGTIRTSGLPLQVAWKNEQSLKKCLVRSALDTPPCPGGGRKCATCMNGLGGRCHTKNVVYEIVCELCEEKKTRNTYIGETKRSVRLRFNEHLRDARHRAPDTPLGDHMTACHPDQRTNIEKSFRISILKVCNDGPNRKITESIFIRDRRPSLNTQTTSWPLL